MVLCKVSQQALLSGKIPEQNDISAKERLPNNEAFDGECKDFPIGLISYIESCSSIRKVRWGAGEE